MVFWTGKEKDPFSLLRVCVSLEASTHTVWSFLFDSSFVKPLAEPFRNRCSIHPCWADTDGGGSSGGGGGVDCLEPSSKRKSACVCALLRSTVRGVAIAGDDDDDNECVASVCVWWVRECGPSVNNICHE